MSRAVIRVSDKDNVAIVVQSSGIKEGDVVMPGIVSKQPIAMGHKIALTDIKEGDAIIRYGHPISFARISIPKGGWINEKNTSIPYAPDLNQIEFVQPKSITSEPLEGYTFQGYKNQDGSVGTKNIFAISTSVQCVAGTTDFIVDKIKNELLPRYSNVDDVVAINHTYGCGVAIDAPAAVIPIRTLKHLAQNPNFGDEIMVVGLGCEKLRPESIVSGNENETIAYLQDEAYQGFEGMTSGLMEIAESHLERLNKRTREACPASDLVVGLQCGGSDAFSGITGNPAAGYAADLIVRAGGTVMFSEVTEVRDAIQPLIERAANKEVAELLKKEMSWYDDYLEMGQSDRSANTSPGNKAGGLSNIVEKALGSVAKSGTSPIVDVIAPGDRVIKKGLNFVATPASDFVCGTLQLAAGMNMHVFITGRGTPYGLREVPVIKVSSNSRLANQWHDLIDLDAGPIARGDKSIEEVGWDLFHLILDVASGRQVASDKIGLYNSQVLFNPGPLT